MKQSKQLLVSLAVATIMGMVVLPGRAAQGEDPNNEQERSEQPEHLVASRADGLPSTPAYGQAWVDVDSNRREPSSSPVFRALQNPLTYIPAATVGVASSLDWASSQRYLRQGWLEANPSFTNNGQSNSTPVDPAAGYRRIVTREIVPVLATSIAINAFSYWLERKGLGQLGKVLRWTSAGALTASSIRSFRQWNRNQTGRP